MFKKFIKFQFNQLFCCRIKTPDASFPLSDGPTGPTLPARQSLALWNQRLKDRVQSIGIHCIACGREMDTVRREQSLLDHAVGIREISPQFFVTGLNYC